PGKVLGGRIFNRELNLVCAIRYPWGCGDSIIGLSKLRGEDAARPVSRSVRVYIKGDYPGEQHWVRTLSSFWALLEWIAPPWASYWNGTATIWSCWPGCKLVAACREN